MIELHLGKRWERSGDTWATGHGHWNGQPRTSTELATIFDACSTQENWTALLKELNGSFALVTAKQTQLIAAVDRLRTTPLFFATKNGKFLLSDDAYWLRGAIAPAQLNSLGALEFYLTGYVTGNETLLDGLRQLRSSECLTFHSSNSAGPKTSRYYEFRHGEFSTASEHSRMDELSTVHSNVFQRLVASAHGRPIVLPLSGGYDSRLIGVSLKNADVSNVLCYSYGTPGNWESRISKELAQYLGFRWTFIPYTREKWKRWSELDEFRRYFHYAGNLTSVPHIQDWPAIWELRETKQLPVDSVIVPGHTGDFLTGGHIPKGFAHAKSISRRQILEAIYASHYSLWDWPGTELDLQRRLDERIEQSLGKLGTSTPEEAADLFEWWELQERQAKFICNALRVYDFFGYEWRLPLFDHELMQFWSRMPLAERRKRSFYFKFVKQRQHLPISEANADRGWIAKAMFAAVSGLGLRGAAKTARRALRKARWEREYENSPYPPFAWYGMLDRELFGRTYTGKESMHSYMTRRYLESVVEVSQGAAP